MTHHPQHTPPPAGDPLDVFPWEAELAEEDAPPADPAPRQRHDAFTEAKKSVFLTW